MPRFMCSRCSELIHEIKYNDYITNFVIGVKM
jgi:hypothetical protein